MSIKDISWFHRGCKGRSGSAQGHSSAPGVPERANRAAVRVVRVHSQPRDRMEFSHNSPERSLKIPKAIPVEVRRALPVEIPKAIPVEVRRALPVEIPKAIPVKVDRTRRLSSLASRSKATLGDRLAADAERICQTGAVRVKPDRLLCYRGVKAALLCNGIVLSGKDRGGAYAWQAADKLAQNSRFQEIRVDRSGQEGQDLYGLSQAGKLAAPRFADRRGRLHSLEHLPAGAIVVWGKGQTPEAGLKYGHISISLGDGREASDRFRPQMQNLPVQCRVFLPRP